jgi:hypothetical protein
VRGTILGGHEGEMHQVAAGQGGAHGQAGKRRFREIAVCVGNLDGFIQRLLGVQDHQRRHQLGDGGDGRGHVRIAGIQYRGVALVDYEHGTGLQFRVADVLGRCLKRQQTKEKTG